MWKKMGIYVGYNSLYILKYLEIQMGDIFKAKFVNCHFDEIMFPTFRGENKLLEKELNWMIGLNPFRS